MPGSDPPESNDNAATGASPRELADSIREDFGRLIETLVREIALIMDPDSAALAALWKAKAAAERGFELAECLSKALGDNDTQR